jgi:Uri superfamily endonuclease
MDLPEEKGTYAFIASVPQMKHIEIGRLGVFDLLPGFYAYVGSAFGAGGLRAHWPPLGIDHRPALAH